MLHQTKQTQPSLLDQVDLCEKRHRGNPQSVEAHKRVIHTKQETYRKILDYVKCAANGATVHEIAEALGYGKAINRASGRLSELKAMGKLVETGNRRAGAAVLRAA